MKTVFRYVGLVLLTPYMVFVVLVIVTFFAVVTILHMPRGLWEYHTWKAKLRRSGRYRNQSVDASSIDHGTLIIDSPTLGWGLMHCWWTPDDIHKVCPYFIPTAGDRESHMRNRTNDEKLDFPFDVWCYQRYLHEDSGTAILLAMRRSNRFAEKILNRSNNVRRVHSWSAPVVMYQKSSTEEPRRDTT